MAGGQRGRRGPGRPAGSQRVAGPPSPRTRGLCGSRRLPGHRRNAGCGGAALPSGLQRPRRPLLGAQAPSTVHALGSAVAALYRLYRPAEPRTTLNVGQVQGGHSVNSIAASSELLLDLRSLDPGALQTLDEQACRALHQAARDTGVTLHLERVGDRPGGPLNAGPLFKLAREAAQSSGFELRQAASSTDANAAIPYGLHALSLGVYRGGQAHREDEWVDPSSHAQGLKFLQKFLALYQARPLA
ncbi:peptidase dimerization domain-containing protein [Deinococcus lacus]|uniref:Peptidase dimerization domain-containing protein n=1 Tax=Deinococcus lacus TaxID=392561 RepID=A0ABW1YAN4_9DEIO